MLADASVVEDRELHAIEGVALVRDAPGSLSSVNPTRAQALSHEGLIADSPQRQSAIWGRVSISSPSQFLSSSAFVTR